jgi:hypothetical protein
MSLVRFASFRGGTVLVPIREPEQPHSPLEDMPGIDQGLRPRTPFGAFLWRPACAILDAR